MTGSRLSRDPRRSTDLPAVARPGERFAYADANYILAGLVIEAVTGKVYAWQRPRRC